MPRSVELYSARRTVEDPPRPGQDGPTRPRGSFLDVEYHPFEAEAFTGVNCLSHSRPACAAPTHVCEIPDGAGLVVEVWGGRPGTYDVAAGGRVYLDAAELLALARQGWRGLRLVEVGAPAEDLPEGPRFTLSQGRSSR